MASEVKPKKGFRTKNQQPEKKGIRNKPQSTKKETPKASLSYEGHWFENVKALPQIELPKKAGLQQKPDPRLVFEKKKLAQELYDQLADDYNQRNKSQAGAGFMGSVLKAGTSSDKLAAMTLLVQQAPVFRLKTVDTLLALARKKGRRETVTVIESLKDLFFTNFLPDDRGLIPFFQRPLSSPGVTNDHLVAWYFEDQLKARFTEFLEILEQSSHDPLSFFRERAIRTIFEILCQKPEGEHKLLNLLVNKLGDTEKKVASKASYLLCLLLEQHPSMKLVLANECETFLHRPNVSLRAQYYTIIFLNQIILSKNNLDVPHKLLSIYFSIFQKVLGIKKGDSISDVDIEKADVESKILGALLTGVNRAVPYVGTTPETNNHLDTLFKVVFVASFNKAIQALSLIWQIMNLQGNITERYYRAFYEKIFSEELNQNSVHPPFLSLASKTLKGDHKIERCAAIIKRLLQVCYYQHPDIICGLLLVISQVSESKPLLGKWIGKACTNREPLSEEIQQTSANLLAFYQSKFQEEPSDFFQENGSFEMPEVVPELSSNDIKTAVLTNYDSRKRDPSFAGAQNEGLWELNILQYHYHPSVAKWAHSLLEEQPIEYQGDPIRDFTLKQFFERFVYKNPKKNHQGEMFNPNPPTASLMQSTYLTHSQRSDPVNTPEFLKQREEDVREDELFFFKYFKQKAQHPNTKQKKLASEDDESEEIVEPISDAEVNALFQKEMDNYEKSTKANNKKKGIDIDSDEDDDFFAALDQEMGSEDFGEQGDDDDLDAGLFGGLSDDSFDEGAGFNELDGPDDFDDDGLDLDGMEGGDEDSEEAGDFASANEFAHILEGSGPSAAEIRELREKFKKRKRPPTQPSSKKSAKNTHPHKNKGSTKGPPTKRQKR